MNENEHTVTLRLYAVTRTVLTYVGARNEYEAIEAAEDVSGDAFDNNEWDWNEYKLSQVSPVPDDGERIDGGMFLPPGMQEAPGFDLEIGTERVFQVPLQTTHARIQALRAQLLDIQRELATLEAR